MIPKVKYKITETEPDISQVMDRYLGKEIPPSVVFDLSTEVLNGTLSYIWTLDLDGSEASFLALKHPELKIEKVSSW
jgi:hypothetical protein